MTSIVCAYDFSEAAETALNIASRLASFFNAKLIITNIYSVPVHTTEAGFVSQDIDLIKQETLEKLEKKVKQLASHWPDLINTEILIDSGVVTHKLSHIAKEKNSDLIVMGIDNDKSFIKEHLLGSTSISEARDNNIPVLIVPKKAQNNKITSVLYACDYKQDYISSKSLIQVKYFVKMFNAGLTVLHVLEPDHELSKSEQKNDKYIENQLNTTEHETFFVYNSNASEGIIQFVKDHAVDLIIVEPHKKNFFERFFGTSTTKELAFHLNVPILAIHG
ncbi:MAG: universal stress protein [Flavobacteriales bacterium]|nr:universal stress protein [Flavobacteriales bacterium]